MSIQQPKVYVSVVNWNNYQDTLTCVASLKQLSYPNLEILVVDNASSNDSVAQIKDMFPDIHVIEAPSNLGFAGGHRIAFDHVKSNSEGLFWILNNDVIVTDTSLIPLIETYQKFGETHLYGGIPLEMNNPVYIDAIDCFHVDTNGRRTKQQIHAAGALYHETFPDMQPLRVTNLHGSNMLIPISVIKRYGFMDEKFFLYGEEMDYCYRLLTQGIVSILVPASTIRHIHGASMTLNTMNYLRLYYLYRGSMVFVRRHFPRKEYLNLIRTNLTPCLKTFLFSSYYRTNHPELYYQCMGIRDAVFNRLGRTLEPNDFYNRQH